MAAIQVGGLPTVPSVAAPTTSPIWQRAQPFVNGGLSGMMAICFIQPIDIVKVRIQLGCRTSFRQRSGKLAPGTSPLAVARNIIQTDGIAGLYKGFSAGLLRQATYATTRMGVFTTLYGKLQKHHGDKKVPLWQKAGCGLSAGAIGAMVGNPADLSLVRMQADSMLPIAERRNYKHVGDALYRTVKDEGIKGLYRGALPTVVRAMALNMGMLTTNAEARDLLEGAGCAKGGTTAVLGSAAIAGVVAATLSLPFDYVKTRMQKMTKNPDGTLPFKNSLDCAVQTLKGGGFTKFYAGYPTYCIRIAPHVVLTLLFNETLPKIQKSIGW